MSDLEPLTGRVRRTRILVLDIESKDGDSQKPGFTRPFLVGIHDGLNYHAFRDTNPEVPWEDRATSEGGCIDLALKFILRPEYRGFVVYAHNGGRFDFLHLMPWFVKHAERLGWLFMVVPVSSAVQLLKVWQIQKNADEQGKKKSAGVASIKFIDSYRLLPLSLDAAAKTFNLKGKLKHDLAMVETDKRWERYNEQDCDQLYQVMKKFHWYVEKKLVGEVGITAASTAMKLLRRAFLAESFPRNEDTHEFVLDAYYGGRTELFRYRGKNLYYFDINSSYPRAMLDLMPGQLIGRFTETIPKEHANSKNVGFVKCDVFVPEMKYPPLPIRGDGETAPPKLIFPTGKLTGTWEFEELMHAVECGCRIEKVHESVWYEGKPLFRDFVNKLYPLRKIGDLGLAAVVKLLLNSCYGKFGQRKKKKKLLFIRDPELNQANATPATGDITSPIWYVEEEIDAPYIIPQVAARVTAIARRRLHEFMLDVEQRGGTVYYCDTDSIMCDIELPSSSELGMLKDEYPKYSGQIDAVFLRPKMYLLKAGGFDEFRGHTFQDLEEVKAKGIELRKNTLTEKSIRAFVLEELFVKTKKRRALSFESLGLGDGKIALAVPSELPCDGGIAKSDDSGDKPVYETAFQFGKRIYEALLVNGHPKEAGRLYTFLRKAVIARRKNKHKFQMLQMNKTLRQWRFEKIGMLAKEGFSHGPRLFLLERTLHDGAEKRERIGDTDDTRALSLDMWGGTNG